jgi:hypothetical protein
VLHGLVGGLAFGLMYWFADGRHALKPSPVRIRLMGGARQLGAKLTTRLKIGIPIGFVFALAVVLLDRIVVAGRRAGGGLGSAITFVSGIGLCMGLVLGLEGAFVGGLGYGLSLTAWGQWVALARIWLPLTRRLPWRLIAFLDDACQRGVLRQAGAVYQFRHARLQGHLTGTNQTGRAASP